jgi:hypothetical protein
MRIIKEGISRVSEWREPNAVSIPFIDANGFIRKLPKDKRVETYREKSGSVVIENPAWNELPQWAINFFSGESIAQPVTVELLSRPHITPQKPPAKAYDDEEISDVVYPQSAWVAGQNMLESITVRIGESAITLSRGEINSYTPKRGNRTVTTINGMSVDNHSLFARFSIENGQSDISTSTADLFPPHQKAAMEAFKNLTPREKSKSMSQIVTFVANACKAAK